MRIPKFKSYHLIIITLLVVIGLGSLILINPRVMADDTTKGQNDVVIGSNIFADIAEDVDNGVVKVTSYVETEYSDRSRHPFFNDPFFEYFFGDQFRAPEREPETQTGFGSGFIVSDDGYIVTNQHVISEAKKIEVTINGFEEPLAAEVAWSDLNLDLAVLKVETEKKLSPIKLGDSDNIRPGEWAVAIGNPFGFEHTVTVGVISALGRPIQIPTREGQVRTYQNLIQLDAAINPGNSGGPLLNIDGEVIGINTAVSTQGQGIGFAIPVNEIKGIVEELRITGDVKRPWLGISFQAVDQGVKEYFNLADKEGVIVMDIFEDSPAAEAGLKRYDIIKEIDEKPIKNTDDVVNIIKETKIDDRILIRVIRGGSSKLIFARIGKKPNQM